MLVSGVQQSESVIHIHIYCMLVYILYIVCSILFSIIGYYKILNIISCAIEEILLLIILCMVVFIC